MRRGMEWLVVAADAAGVATAAAAAAAAAATAAVVETRREYQVTRCNISVYILKTHVSSIPTSLTLLKHNLYRISLNNISR